MKTLRFYGTSDDLFEVEGDVREEIDVPYPGSGAYRVYSAREGRGLFVVAQYAPGCTDRAACWVIGVSQLEEDVSLPAWPMRFETHKEGYSVVLVVEAPDDVRVTESAGRPS